MGVGTVNSDVPQVLQKRAGGELPAPHLGHVTTDICLRDPLSSQSIVGINF